MKIRRCTHHPCGPKTYVGPLDTSSRDSVELVVLIKARKGGGGGGGGADQGQEG